MTTAAERILPEVLDPWPMVIRQAKPPALPEVSDSTFLGLCICTMASAGPEGI